MMGKLAMIIHIDVPVLPLESWRELLPEGNRPEVDALKTLARRGRLPGAFQPEGSSEWWINIVAAMQFGVKQEHEKEEGNGLSSSDEGEVSRPMANKRKERIRRSS